MKAKELQKLAHQLRKDILRMTHAAKAGHPGGSLSMIDIVTALYFDKLNVDPNKPKDPERDRFILSKGHASPGMYAVLAEKGFFPKEELMKFRKIDSLLQGHTDIRVPGVEMSAGSLGMGVSYANGIAFARKLDNRSYHIYVMLGDGETQEGQIWEAAMNTSFHKLKITTIIDKNRIQNDDFVEKTLVIDPLDDKWKAFGWDVIEIDGHDMDEILKALEKAEKSKGPVAIIADTIKGKGVSFMENNPEFHGKAPNDEELKKGLEELDAKIRSLS
ncbi:transketolase [Candidatus Woesearchaeota archaeon]|nr:transketolase [Candidatus Woesearchaeota archaeon]